MAIGNRKRKHCSERCCTFCFQGIWIANPSNSPHSCCHCGTLSSTARVVMTCTRSFGGPLGLTVNGLRAVGWPDCLRRFQIKLSRVIPNQIVWFWVGPILTRVLTTSLTAIWSNSSDPTGKLFQNYSRLLTSHLTSCKYCMPDGETVDVFLCFP